MLSAHGEEVVDGMDRVELPKNFFMHAYVPEGMQVFCTNKKPNQICADPSQASHHYKPGSFVRNASLWPDSYGAFHSGVKDCSNNEIVVNIDKVGSTTLQAVVAAVNVYHQRVYPGKVAHLHCLYCRDRAMGGRRKTRRVKGGIPRDVMESLHEAEQKGIEDAKKAIFKRYTSAPGFRIEEVARILSRKYPGVDQGRIREKYVEGFANTRRPNPGTQGSSRRKTRKARGGVSREMVDALRAAETQGRTDKQNGVSSRADAIAGSIMNQFRLADFGTPSARTLIRDKYTATYQQTPASGLPPGRPGFLEAMPSDLQSIVDRLRALAS